MKLTHLEYKCSSLDKLTFPESLRELSLDVDQYFRVDPGILTRLTNLESLVISVDCQGLMMIRLPAAPRLTRLEKLASYVNLPEDKVFTLRKFFSTTVSDADLYNPNLESLEHLELYREDTLATVYPFHTSLRKLGNNYCHARWSQHLLESYSKLESLGMRNIGDLSIPTSITKLINCASRAPNQLLKWYISATTGDNLRGMTNLTDLRIGWLQAANMFSFPKLVNLIKLEIVSTDNSVNLSQSALPQLISLGIDCTDVRSNITSLTALTLRQLDSESSYWISKNVKLRELTIRVGSRSSLNLELLSRLTNLEVLNVLGSRGCNIYNVPEYIRPLIKYCVA